MPNDRSNMLLTSSYHDMESYLQDLERCDGGYKEARDLRVLLERSLAQNESETLDGHSEEFVYTAIEFYKDYHKIMRDYHRAIATLVEQTFYACTPATQRKDKAAQVDKAIALFYEELDHTICSNDLDEDLFDPLVKLLDRFRDKLNEFKRGESSMLFNSRKQEATDALTKRSNP